MRALLFVASAAIAPPALAQPAFDQTDTPAAKPQEYLPPVSPWHLNYAEDSCRLMRSFGTGDDTGMVYFERFGPGDGFNLVVAGKRLLSINAESKLQIRFGDGEEHQEPEFFIGEFGDYGPAVIFRPMQINRSPAHGLRGKALDEYWEQVADVPIEPVGAERERAVTWLSISRGKRSYVTFDLGPMDKPFAALRNCTNDQLRYWGIDVERHDTLSRKLKPVQSPGTWLKSEDYPRLMARIGQQGIIHFRIVVDETGKPSSCHIQQSTRPKEFDDVVCKRLMERATFEPALDAQGAALKSF